MGTLHPSQVKAPKWKPAAGSSHTLHSCFICTIIVIPIIVIRPGNWAGCQCLAPPPPATRS